MTFVMELMHGKDLVHRGYGVQVWLSGSCVNRIIETTYGEIQTDVKDICKSHKNYAAVIRLY